MNNKLWQSLVNAWKIPDLRTKLVFTAAMVAIYRFGSYVPVPGIDLAALRQFFEQGGAGVIGFLDLFSGGALARVALFALGIMPYIPASIIMQLLTVVIPKLELMGLPRRAMPVFSPPLAGRVRHDPVRAGVETSVPPHIPRVHVIEAEVAAVSRHE